MEDAAEWSISAKKAVQLLLVKQRHIRIVDLAHVLGFVEEVRQLGRCFRVPVCFLASASHQEDGDGGDVPCTWGGLVCQLPRARLYLGELEPACLSFWVATCLFNPFCRWPRKVTAWAHK